MTSCFENDIVIAIVYQKNAETRSSTFILEFRKLSGDVRQRKRYRELTFERLPEIGLALDDLPENYREGEGE